MLLLSSLSIEFNLFLLDRHTKILVARERERRCLAKKWLVIRFRYSTWRHWTMEILPAFQPMPWFCPMLSILSSNNWTSLATEICNPIFEAHSLNWKNCIQVSLEVSFNRSSVKRCHRWLPSLIWMNWHWNWRNIAINPRISFLRRATNKNFTNWMCVRRISNVSSAVFLTISTRNVNFSKRSRRSPAPSRRRWTVSRIRINTSRQPTVGKP